MNVDIIHHYPPEILNLLVDAIPLLCRSKNDVLVFFKGAGVPGAVTADFQRKLAADRSSVNKYEITREVLVRLNDKGEASLRERREILKRVIEFEDFSTCWPADQLKAKGLVAEIRRVVDVKDSFGRMRQEQDDGVIELDGEIYLVEMKWWDKPLGTGEVSQHLVRVFSRHCARGLLISYSGFTDPAVVMCKEALARMVVVLAGLREIVHLLEREDDLAEFLRRKVRAAVIDKNPHQALLG